MYDRVSQNPGRVLITPEDGSGAFYATLALADNPTVVGTPLNAANLLSQATASLYGLLSNATPDDAFVKAKSMIDNAQNTANGKSSFAMGSYVGTVSGVNTASSKTLEFSGDAKLLMIMCDGTYSLNFLVTKDTTACSFLWGVTVRRASLSWGASTVTISVEDGYFINAQDVVYRYVFFK